MAHSYPFSLEWHGNTLNADYPRNAVASAAGKADLAVSSAPEFAGDTLRWNPEDMLGAALANCHMLTFLALAAKAKLEVKAYEDHAEAILDTVDKVTSVTTICLRPTIRVAQGTSMAKVLDLFQKAHKYCFVANSIKSKVVMEPRIVEG